jgi:hypothetical protein
VSLTPEERERYEARKARLRAVLAAMPPQERGADFAEGLRQDIEFLRPQRMRANAMLLDDDDRETVSALWAEDWDCPEDAVYDIWTEESP